MRQSLFNVHLQLLPQGFGRFFTQGHKGSDALAFDFVGLTNDRRFGDCWMRHQCAFDFMVLRRWPETLITYSLMRPMIQNICRYPVERCHRSSTFREPSSSIALGNDLRLPKFREAFQAKACRCRACLHDL